MAQNTTITLTAGEWTQLTNANVNSITFQNIGRYHVFLKGTTDTTPPTDRSGAIRANPGQGELNAFMSDLFPGIAAVRLWAFCDQSVEVFVSHA